MRSIAAHLLLRMGGTANPSADNIRALLAAGGVSVDEDKLQMWIARVENDPGLVGCGLPFLAHEEVKAEEHEFRFGIEPEMYLQPRKKSFESWREVAETIQKSMEIEGIPTVTNYKDYSRWSIVRDGSVPNFPSENKCEPYQCLLSCDGCRLSRVADSCKGS